MDRRTFLVLLGGLGPAACGSPASLANTRSSPEEVARSVLSALERRDRAALEALVLSEQEFRDHVWPELPAARPERNLPFSYVWGDLHQKSTLGLNRTLAAHGGRHFELVGVTFSRETRYPSYVVHHDSTLRVRATDGSETDLRVCGSMMVKGDGWKIFSYVTDN